MLLSFPTRPSGGDRYLERRRGFPLEAEPCRCERPLHAHPDEECVWCGKLSVFVIRETWRRQAQKLAA